MGINSYNPPSSTPIDRLASLMGVVSAGKGLYDQFSESAKKARLEDPDSEESKNARALAAKITGNPIPDYVTGKQLESFSPIAYAAEQRKFAQEKEMVGIKGAEDRKTAAVKRSQETAANKRLPPDKVLSVNAGNAIPKMLTEIEKTIDMNAPLFGPVAGRIGELNPYDTQSQTVDAQMRTASQAFGRFMEGGVLRKEDEDKYRRMFPKLGDTPDVARNRLQLIAKMLKDKQESDVTALGAAGYDVAGLRQPLPEGGIPGVLRGGGSKKLGDGLIPEALAGQGAQFDAEDLQAMEWAQANPKDPRSGQIMMRLRQKGLR